MKLITILALLAASSVSNANPVTPPSAYANASLLLTSSNQSELATATATSGVGFADAFAQPGLVQNALLTTLPSGSSSSYATESVSGFSDILTITDSALTGNNGSLQFHFLFSGAEIATAWHRRTAA